MLDVASGVDHESRAFLSDVAAVVEHDLAVVVERLARAQSVETALGRVVLAEELCVVGRNVFVRLAALDVDVELSRDVEILGHVPFGVDRVAKGLVARGAETRQRGIVERVGLVAFARRRGVLGVEIEGFDQLAVLVVGRLVGVEFRVGAEFAVGRIRCVGQRVVGRVTERELVAHVVAYRKVERVVAAVVALHDAVLVAEAQRRAVVDLLCAAAQRERVGVAERYAQRGAYPVGVDAPADVLQFVGVSLVHRAVVRFVKPGQAFQFQFLRRVAEVHRTQVRDAQLGHEVVAQAGFAVGHLLAFDDDYAVGRPVAVDDRGLRVLQDVDALDFVHVEVVQLFHADFGAVEDDQRVVVGLLLGRGGDGVRAADQDFGNGVGVRAEGVVLYDHHARGHGAQGRHQVGVRDGHEVFALDRGHRTRVGALVAGEHAVDHHVVDARAALLEGDVQALRRAGDDHLLGLHAQEPDFEDRRAGLGREGEGELALFIGRDALSRAAFQNDRCAGEHRLAGVAHGSAHGELAHLDRRVVDQHDVVLDGVFERRPGDALVEQFVYGDFLEFAAHGREPADVFGVVGEFDACLPGDFVEHRRRGSLRQRDGERRVQVDRFTPPLRPGRSGCAA